jgi:Holliday junction resolvase
MMPNAAYRDGRKLEYAAAADLRSNGYTVLRMAGSHGIVDLIAVKPGELLFIQCKLDGYLTPRERAGLLELARPPDREALLAVAGLTGGVPVLACWQKDGRHARVIEYRELTGPGPRDWRAWTPDWAMEAL